MADILFNVYALLHFPTAHPRDPWDVGVHTEDPMGLAMPDPIPWKFLPGPYRTWTEEEIIMTNQNIRAHNTFTHGLGTTRAGHRGRLVCRWKYERVIKPQQHTQRPTTHARRTFLRSIVATRYRSMGWKWILVKFAKSASS